MDSQQAQQPEDNRFKVMLEESKKLTRLIGIPDSTILDIYFATTDWEFILKIDALLEAAVKQVVKTNLGAGSKINKDKLEAFIDALPMRGRTSLVELLKACRCDESEVTLIDCVRRLRNGFAHDIVQVNDNLIDVIKKRNDRSYLIGGLSYIENYDEDELIKIYEDDGKMLRFGILHGTMIFLILAYHVGMGLPTKPQHIEELTSDAVGHSPQHRSAPSA